LSYVTSYITRFKVFQTRLTRKIIIFKNEISLIFLTEFSCIFYGKPSKPKATATLATAAETEAKVAVGKSMDV
jgi:hypothetical protein